MAGREALIAAYERHNDEVRRRIAPHRLVEWRTGDGWGAGCRALGEPVPDVAVFPHTNTADEFRQSLELEGEKG